MKIFLKKRGSGHGELQMEDERMELFVYSRFSKENDNSGHKYVQTERLRFNRSRG